MPSSAPATTPPYTLSLHDALPICPPGGQGPARRHHRRQRLHGDAEHALRRLQDLRPRPRGRPRIDRGLHRDQDRRRRPDRLADVTRSEEHTSELQSPDHLVCRLLLLRPPRPTLFPYTTLFRSAHRVAKALRAGTIGVNGFMVMPNTPFGGYKTSGLGREGGRESIEAFTETKTVDVALTDSPM